MPPSHVQAFLHRHKSHQKFTLCLQTQTEKPIGQACMPVANDATYWNTDGMYIKYT